MSLRDRIGEIVRNGTDGLVGFQLATVDRVLEQFQGGGSGRRRVLVADEVGLGKTHVAKGVIAKLAERRYNEGANLFRVVYVCSNLNIIAQNIDTLRFDKNDASLGRGNGDMSDLRLSMQHLAIVEAENDERVKSDFIQFIPLTPDTSFNVMGGIGKARERALMCVILEEGGFVSGASQRRRLRTALRGDVRSDERWQGDLDDFATRFSACRDSLFGRTGKGRRPRRKYADFLFRELRKQLNGKDVIERLLTRRSDWKKGTRAAIKELRLAFCNISTMMLDPDLVIMDEFQRFRSLLLADIGKTAIDDRIETSVLVRKFLKSDEKMAEFQPLVLLLSATPYKPYATLAEINREGLDIHEEEFRELARFIFSDSFERFNSAWSGYSRCLAELGNGNVAFADSNFKAAKSRAENAFYDGVVRTERLLGAIPGKLEGVAPVVRELSVDDNDIASYLDFAGLLGKIGVRRRLRVEYAKSCPFLLSFMNRNDKVEDSYQVKRLLENELECHPEKIPMARLSRLWLDSRVIEAYGILPKCNATLECLKEYAFDKKAECFLWVPPSKPYYDLQGVYKESGGFSKTLVFSSWEMVPRMVASLLSYEAERLTVGVVQKRRKGTRDGARSGYCAGDTKRRYPEGRLNFKSGPRRQSSLSLFALLYPSRALSGMYDPVACLREGLSLAQIRKELVGKIKARLMRMRNVQKGREDARWYYLAPMLLDGNGRFSEWLEEVEEMHGVMRRRDEDGKTVRDCLNALQRDYCMSDQLGRRPADLAEVLADMAIASPAICLFRAGACGGEFQLAEVSDVAYSLLAMFNSPEATAIVDLTTGKGKNAEVHWKNVLKYCAEGCLQAVIDEYAYALGGLECTEHFRDVLDFRAGSYRIDTLESLEKRVTGDFTAKDDTLPLRTHFAVGYTKGGETDKRKVDRKTIVRNAFNSPFRPFVLASTSIGQEGLDFHRYCRRVFHWNLPSNPVDMEQREGRVNRYKCLAVRKNVAADFPNDKLGRAVSCTNLWRKMFESADRNGDMSGMVPYWRYEGSFQIERIVPQYPYSRDQARYERICDILLLYRLTLGQPRQEELLEHLLKHCPELGIDADAFINLCPWLKASSHEWPVSLGT